MVFFARRRRDLTPAAAPMTGPGRLGDLLAPDALQLETDHAVVDGLHATTLALTRLPSEAPAGWFAAATTQLEACDIAQYVEPRPTGPMLSHIRRELGRLQGARSQAEKDGMVADSARDKAIRQLTELAERLQYDERVVQHAVYLTLYAQGKQALERRVNALETALGLCGAATCRLVLEVMRGLRSTLPTAEIHADHAVELPAAGAMTLLNFGAPRLFMPDGLWFGINRQNGEFVVVDPFAPVFDNAHGVIIAKSRAGKSFALKTIFGLRGRASGAQVIVLDPENEYEILARAMGGAVIALSPQGRVCINPLALPQAQRATAVEPGLFNKQVEDVQGFLGVILSSQERELSAAEKAILDDAIVRTYAAKGITDDPATHGRTPPTLVDLMTTLHELENSLGTTYELGLRVRRYALGAFSGLFGGQTTPGLLSSALTVFTLRELSRDLWPAAMYVVSQFVWTQAYADHTLKRYYIVDEAQRIVREPSGYGNRMLGDVAARGAKYGVGLVAATQHARPFLESSAGMDLLASATWTLLLAQEEAGIATLRELVALSEQDAFYLKNRCDRGQGLLITPNPYRRDAEKVGLYVSIRASKHMEPYVRRDRETPLDPGPVPAPPLPLR